MQLTKEQQDKLRERFTNNFSNDIGSTYLRDSIAEYWLSRIDELLKEQKEELVEKGEGLKEKEPDDIYCAEDLFPQKRNQAIEDYQSLIKE